MPDLEELNKHKPVVGKKPTLNLASPAKGTVQVHGASITSSGKATITSNGSDEPTRETGDDEPSGIEVQSGKDNYPTTATKEDESTGKPTQENAGPSEKKSEQPGDRREDGQDSSQDRRQNNEAENKKKQEEERKRKENESNTNKNKDKDGEGEGGGKGPGEGGPETPGGGAGAGESGLGGGAGGAGAGEGLVGGGAGGAAGAGATGAAGAGGAAAAGGGALAAEAGGAVAVAAAPEIGIGAAIVLGVCAILLLGVMIFALWNMDTGKDKEVDPNPITQHDDILTTLAKTGNFAARQELMKNHGKEILASLQLQADGETDATNKKIIQDLIVALSALKPNVDYTIDYSTVPKTTGTDQSTWTDLQKQRKVHDDVEATYAAYQKVAQNLTAFAAANKLIAWVNAHPQAANQAIADDAYRSSAHGLPTAKTVIGRPIGNNCWNAVWYVLQVVFPGSNGRGPAGVWLDRGKTIPTVAGQGPTTPTDFTVAQQTLAKGQLPVWHVKGATDQGQHWIVVVAVDPAKQEVTEYDPGYGKIVTLSPSATNGPAWVSPSGGNYLGYSSQGAKDGSAFQRGFPFSPTKPKAN